MDVITSRENPRIKRACALRDSEKQRAAAGLFFAEGPKLCLELARGCRAAELYATAPALAHHPRALAALGPAVAEITQAGGRKARRNAQHAGRVRAVRDPRHRPGPAAGRRAHGASWRWKPCRTPGNVGTLLRSAAAFGFDAVLLGPGCAAPFSPKVLRASMGAAGPPAARRLRRPARGARRAARPRRRLPGRRAVQGPARWDAVGTQFPRRGLRRHRQRGPGAERTPPSRRAAPPCASR